MKVWPIFLLIILYIFNILLIVFSVNINALFLGAMSEAEKQTINADCEEIIIKYNVVDTSKMSTQETFYLNLEKKAILCEVSDE